jgi:hypothetical protein
VTKPLDHVYLLQVLNLRLNSTEKSGRRRYFLREADQFDSLIDLVEFYRKNPLPVQEEIKLKETVPNQIEYEREVNVGNIITFYHWRL